VYLLTHLAQAKAATQLWVHLALRAQSYCTWYPDATAVCLTQGMFLLMSYSASSGNESLSPVRVFLFMMLQNFIYKQKSMQANIGLP